MLKKNHNDKVSWISRLPVPASLIWLPEDSSTDEGLLAQAAEQLGIPTSGLGLMRDSRGRPYAALNGAPAANLHVSNTHDGGERLLLLAQSDQLAGIGLDIVHLPRLRRPGKDATYLHRMARRFMGNAEWVGFEKAASEDTDEELRVRVAAHFSLMEAASKALGTGIKLLDSLPSTLPVSSISILSLQPDTLVIFEGDAEAHKIEIEGGKCMAYWEADNNFLVSAVLIMKNRVISRMTIETNDRILSSKI